MKRFLISISVLLSFAASSHACGYEDYSDKYYMFSYCDNSFADNYRTAMDRFWQDYTGKDYRPGFEELIKSAVQKKDMAMQIYLQHLQKYDDISSQVQNSWSYPTAMELAQRKSQLRSIVNVAQHNLNGKYGNRWALLLMRANMLLNDHQANITFFTAKTKQYPADCYKDMMRNIYARDLLLTGKKQQAWNIYAEQNDQQSLLWSVRKFTNLAGIMSICKENPNAPVLNYLVQTYVNRIQTTIDARTSELPYINYSNVAWGEAYAPVSTNQDLEFKNFVAYAKQMAQGGKTKVPCMWMSAASLVNYFTGNFSEAKSCIDEALDMKGTDAMKDNARRIRMLVEPMVADIQSDGFKTFMATELRWLDSQIKSTENSPEAEARERIIKHGLAEQYKRCGDESMHLALCAVTDFNDYDRFNDWYQGRFNYSSPSFSIINKMTAAEVKQYFAMLDNANDPLKQYLSAKLSSRYDANFRNDLIGTKLIAENRPADALPYLRKVDHKYLENQAIAYYASQRNYNKPYWDGFQSCDAPMYDDEGNLAKVSLKSNIKVDFCEELISTLNKYGAADADSRKFLAYKLANRYYQASYKGQCWFLTHYGQSIMDEQNPKEANFPEIARRYLAEAASSNDTNLKMSALFGQIAIAPDQWVTYDYDDNYDLVAHVQRNSQQYKALKTLDAYTREVGFEKTFISNCDVIAQFRNQL